MEEAKHEAETKYEMCCDNARQEVNINSILYYTSCHLILTFMKQVKGMKKTSHWLIHKDSTG